jgi:hypothetical protein
MSISRSRDFLQVFHFKLKLGSPIPKRYQGSVIGDKFFSVVAMFFMVWFSLILTSASGVGYRRYHFLSF